VRIKGTGNRAGSRIGRKQAVFVDQHGRNANLSFEKEQSVQEVRPLVYKCSTLGLKTGQIQYSGNEPEKGTVVRSVVGPHPPSPPSSLGPIPIPPTIPRIYAMLSITPGIGSSA